MFSYRIATFARFGFLLAATLFFSILASHAQMRKIYLDPDQSTGNDLSKLSFYSPSEGFVGFSKWIGFTSDSGRTFTKKTITMSNVDYNGYSVNLTFGFDIMGIKAFDRNTLIAYGNYGFIPAILYSTNGGNTFKLINLSQASSVISLTNGFADMDFDPNSNTGFAVDEDRVLKTVDKGQSWGAVYTSLSSYYNYVQALDKNVVFAASMYADAASKLQRTMDGGSTWQILPLPSPTDKARLLSAYFIDAFTGWIMLSDNGKGYFYKTGNAGLTWTLLNNVEANPFPARRMKFLNYTTGYAVDDYHTVYKTTSGGAVWEPLPQDTNIPDSGYSINDIQLMGNNQLWAGYAWRKMLEISTNAGGIPLPKAFPFVDTTGVNATNKVALVNYSAKTYTYQWFVNDTLISTDYNSSYIHTRDKLIDTITLVVFNGTIRDTGIYYAHVKPWVPPAPLPVITSFSPTTGATGATVTVKGTNLYVNETVPTVTIGGVPAKAVYVYLDQTALSVIVGNGATGDIIVTTPGGSDTIGTFTYIPPPVITSFSPASATLGDVITIKGKNFTGTTKVSFGDTISSSFTVLSDTLIKGTVWLGASGLIKVTRPSGTGQADGFIFIPPPAPAITGLSVYSGTSGTPVKIYGTHFYGTLTVRIGGTDVNSFTVVSDNEIDMFVGFNQSGDVQVTTLFGSGSYSSFSIVQPPHISFFFPKSGSIGSTVTFTGSYFSTKASENIVYFGGVKAKVLAASAAQLNVQVPYGATYQPISVTVKNGTAYSSQPFLVTSLNAARTLTDSSFQKKKDLPSGGYYKSNVTLADFDGDGRADIASSQTGVAYGQNIDVIRNLSTPGNMNFETAIHPATDYFPVQVVPCDLDGDGKFDILSLSQRLQAFKNTSRDTGTISFAPAINIRNFLHPDYAAASDLNGDGKPDVVVMKEDSDSVYVFGNISTPDSIAFASPLVIPINSTLRGTRVAINDMDADGKPDFLFVCEWGLYVLRNTGENRSFAFTVLPMISTATGKEYLPPSPNSIAIGDIDGDDKPDVVVGQFTQEALTVLRNISSPGTISFDTAVAFYPGYHYTESIAIEDMDGDGRPDLTLTDYYNNYTLVMKNTSVRGRLFFNAPLKYYTVAEPKMVATGDLDLDGRPDIVTNNIEYTYHSIFRNESEVSAVPPIADTNYLIRTIDATCRGTSNGRISITFAQALGYTVILSATGIGDSSYVVGYTYEKDSLPAGAYQLCFRIDGYPAYRKCFTVVIGQPKDLSAYFTPPTGASDAMLAVTLDGSDLYNIDLNGNRFQTGASSLSLPLQAGINTITVQTPRACQGSITKTFYLPPDSTKITLIPNPAKDIATLYVQGNDTQVEIEVLSVDGRVIDKRRSYAVGSDRMVRLNVSHYAGGMYVVRVQGSTMRSSVKLVKAQ